VSTIREWTGNKRRETKMNEQIKEKWIEKLESGEYSQGQGRLRIKNEEGGPDKFCCLGVLADIINPNGWKCQQDVSYYSGKEVYCYIFDNEGSDYIPEDIADEIGLSTQDQNELAQMNDSGKKFHEIAEEIRNRL
jgi:hypothetical protein